jgi:ABC-type transport system substrate-binding protein
VQYITPVALIDDLEARVTRGGMTMRGAGQDYGGYLTTAIPSAQTRWRGNNRPGYSNPDYDRTFRMYEQAFVLNERVQLMAQMERIVSIDRPILMATWESLVNSVAHGLEGVELRMTQEAGGPEPWVHKWEWRN